MVLIIWNKRIKEKDTSYKPIFFKSNFYEQMFLMVSSWLYGAWAWVWSLGPYGEINDDFYQDHTYTKITHLSYLNIHVNDKVKFYGVWLIKSKHDVTVHDQQSWY